MPVVQVQMLRGRTSEQKRLLIAEITRVMVDVTGVRGDRVNVIINELEAENWGRDGIPIGDAAAPTKAGSRADL